VSALLFATYLGVNLGALLLAAQSQQQPRRYLNSTAVTLSELMKLVMSLIAMRTAAPSSQAALRVVYRAVISSPEQFMHVAFPALLYTIQNNIIYAALGHLDVLTFQITYQLKIVAAMIASRLLLNKRAPPLRWLSVALLTMGVVLVQLSQADAATTKAPAEASNAVLVAGSGKASAIRHQQAASSSDGGEGPKRNRALGLLGVLVACACSGLAGGVMELLLKSSSVPLPARNVQVAAVSLLLASAHMLANDRDALQTRGFFQVVARDGRVPIHHFPTVAFAPVVSAAHPCPWPFRVLASDRPRATRRRCGQWWVSTPSVACLCRYYLSTPLPRSRTSLHRSASF